MKYITDNKTISETPIYKKYKLFSGLTREEQGLVNKNIDRYTIFYYLIENNEVIHYTRNKQDFMLADNCKVATQKEVDKYELENLREAKLNELKEFEGLNDCYILTLIDNKGNSLTKHDKWLHNLISPFVAFFDDKGKVIEKELSLELIGKIKAEMNKKSFAIKTKWAELNYTITKATKKTLESTDYIQILKDMPREINIDLL